MKTEIFPFHKDVLLAGAPSSVRAVCKPSPITSTHLSAAVCVPVKRKTQVVSTDGEGRHHYTRLCNTLHRFQNMCGLLVNIAVSCLGKRCCYLRFFCDRYLILILLVFMGLEGRLKTRYVMLTFIHIDIPLIFCVDSNK